MSRPHWSSIPGILVLIAAMLPSLVSASATAQQDPPELDRDNAAYWYNRAWQSYMDAGLTNDQQSLISDFANSSMPPSDEVRQAVRAMSDAIRAMLRGVDETQYSQQLDYSQGFSLLLPHLSQQRTLGRVLAADARLRLFDLDASGAALRISAMYELSGQTGHDDILISSLVGMSIFRMGEKALNNAIDMDGFSAAEAQVLLNATQELNPDDPFSVMAAMSMEKDLFLETLSEEYRTPEGMVQFLDEFVWMAESDKEREEWAQHYQEHSVDDELEQAAALMDAYAECFEMEDRDAARARMDELEAELVEGEHGLIAKLFLPAYSKVFENFHTTRDQLHERLDMLESIVNGEASIESFRNAALLYAEAMAQFERLTDEQRDLLDRCAAGAADAGDLAMAPILEEVAPILDLMREASLLKRCNFSVIHEIDEPFAAPRHAVGFDGLFNLVESATRAALAREQGELAADLISVELRAIHHLHDEGSLMLCLRAARGLESITALARSQDPETFGTEGKRFIAEALDRFDESDPNGVTREIKGLADQLYGRYFAEAFRRLNFAEEPDPPDISASEEGRVIVHMLLASLPTEAHTAALNDDVEAAVEVAMQPIESFHAMSEVIDLAAYEAVIRDAPRTIRLIDEGTIRVYSNEDLPRPVNIRAGLTSAKNALRLTKRMFPLPDASESGNMGSESLTGDQ